MKINLTVVLCIFAMFKMIGQKTLSDDSDSFQFVPQLCYEKSETTRILIQDELNTETLQTHEKLLFKTTSLKNLCVSSFDPSENAVNQIFTLSHSNLYPKWFEPATETVRTEDGVRSYYDNPMDIFPDGWVGEHTATGLGGAEYSIEKSTGRPHSYTKHTAQGLQAYKISNQVAKDYGFLAKVRFQIPKLSELGDREYTYTEGVLTVVDGEKTYVWDTNSKSSTQLVFKGPKLIKSVNKWYMFNDLLKDYVISTTQTVEHLQFENGDCYSKKSVINYDNYGVDCQDGKDDFDFRFTEEKSEVNKIQIYPNPSSEEITIEIPQYEGKSKVFLYSVDGKLLLQRSISAGKELFTLDITHFNNGLHLVNVIQGENSYSTKFSKI